MKLFIAQTIDGFIAGEDGSLDHLTPFQQNNYGYEEHLKTVDAVVLGRSTFDTIYPSFGWPYPPHLPGIVMTSRPLPQDVPDNVTAATDPVAVARAHPRAYLDGGGTTIRMFMERGLVREAQIFTIPIRLGRGIRLFPQAEGRNDRWTLKEVKGFPCGTVGSHYIIGQT